VRELQDLPEAERRKVALEILERLGMLVPAGGGPAGSGRRDWSWWGRLIAPLVGLAVGVGLYGYRKNAPGRIEVTMDPADATVLVDGRPVGNHSPVTGEQKPGRHKLTVERAGYLPNTGTFYVTAKRTERMRVNLDPSTETGFEIVSDPPGVPVFLDGMMVNGPYGPARTNFRASRIPPGPHVLELRDDRFLPWRGDVNVEADRIVTVHAVLVRAGR